MATRHDANCTCPRCVNPASDAAVIDYVKATYDKMNAAIENANRIIGAFKSPIPVDVEVEGWVVLKGLSWRKHGSKYCIHVLTHEPGAEYVPLESVRAVTQADALQCFSWLRDAVRAAAHRQVREFDAIVDAFNAKFPLEIPHVKSE